MYIYIYKVTLFQKNLDLVKILKAAHEVLRCGAPSHANPRSKIPGWNLRALGSGRQQANSPPPLVLTSSTLSTQPRGTFATTLQSSCVYTPVPAPWA